MKQSDVHFFGIRHHGPGSARRLCQALERLNPAKILIEGPADCNELMRLLANSAMEPPVALLAYAVEDPASAIYYPFAEYSPEYQAVLYANSQNVPVELIDLPVAVQLAQRLDEKPQEDEEGKDSNSVRRDPIGVLAELGGYEDSESWWNDHIEQNAEGSQVFTSVEEAMIALRKAVQEDDEHPDRRETQREAHMRLAIAKACKDSNGPVAVVCGAWHVPALRMAQPAKADREQLKALPRKLPKSKSKVTWVPWTSPRLASASGYGAGVPAPAWYSHLWAERNNGDTLEKWLVKVAAALRKAGHIVSTASIIEASRLSTSLAAIRSRPQPGFEELRESVISCLCFGEPARWRQIEHALLFGSQVGSVPKNVPLVPLLEDLKKHQKKNRLKAEALPKELSIDLRSDSGHERSTLLHRLRLLDVPWGELTHSGGSRGTFRENWVLQWEPEYAVQLLENLVYGSTIEQAASNKTIESMQSSAGLSVLAENVKACLEAQLTKAADIGLTLLVNRATLASDCKEILQSLPPLANIQRYGTAREMSLSHIEELIRRLTTQAAISLPFACRNLALDEARYLHELIDQAHQAVMLAELEAEAVDAWWSALREAAPAAHTTPLIAGFLARLLYETQYFEQEDLLRLLHRALSPATKASDAAEFFEGFFSGAAQKLLYDRDLLSLVENWLLHLDENTFIEHLPLLRRVFSTLDSTERSRLLRKAKNQDEEGLTLFIDSGLSQRQWQGHLSVVMRLLEGDPTWTQR